MMDLWRRSVDPGPAAAIFSAMGWSRRKILTTGGALAANACIARPRCAAAAIDPAALVERAKALPRL
ncbi:MAG: hypothetical protein KDG49_15705, partial [Geminicoccaceae bacterium]|nr:hypothetical protein [Geminicoccaceae bacterium]